MESNGRWVANDIPINKIRLDPKNRKTLAKIPEMVASMKEKGQLVPIIVVPYAVRNDTVKIGADALKEPRNRLEYWLTDGERRYRAARKLRMSTLAARIRINHITWLEAFEIQLSANGKRLDMNPVDFAECIDRYLQEFHAQNPTTKISAAIHRVAEVSGFSTTHVKGRLAILWAPLELQEKIRNGDSRANIPIEIKRNVPQKYQTLALQAAAHGPGPINVLDFRNASKKISAVERLPLDEATRERFVQAIIKTGGRTPLDKKDRKPDLDQYRQEIAIWKARLLQWNLSLPDAALDMIGTDLEDLRQTFLNLQRAAMRVTKPGEVNNRKLATRHGKVVSPKTVPLRET